MHQLPVPLLLARARVQSHQRIAVKVVSDPVRAVKVRGRRAERRIHDPALHVDAEKPPNVRPRAILPRIGGTPLRPPLTLPRQRIKSPKKHARSRVPPSDVALGPLARTFFSGQAT